MSRFQSIRDVHDFLQNIPMFGVAGSSAANFDLGNIRTFCDAMGNPQDRVKSIHIAGTNGKGTTAGLLESIYRAAGYKTGLFTSPHLEVYNERVQINGVPISDEHLLSFFRQVEPLISSIPLTYFEWSTALAFFTFAQEKVEVAIIEVGLGGRLDSTNIITPEISVITSIGLDHEAILGNSLTSIAREKAGIIKTGKPVVVGDLEPEALEEVTNWAHRQKAEIYFASDLAPQFEAGLVRFYPDKKFLTNFMQPIERWNVAIAFLVVNALRFQFYVEEDKLKQGIEAFPGLPGRFEKMVKGKEWYFSGGHNQPAIAAMKETVRARGMEPDAVIFSLMSDKAKPEILEEFSEFSPLYFYQQEGSRAAQFGDVAKVLTVTEIKEESFLPILKELRSQLVIFAGSFYFYGTVKRWLSQID